MSENKPIDPKPIDKELEQTLEDTPLMKRLFAVFEEVTTKKLAAIEKTLEDKVDAMEKRFDGKIEKSLSAKEIEMERALRKGFGLESDPVIHMSDLIAYGRKGALEKADTGKRTPAKEGEKGPEGTVATDSISKMFENARKGGLQ